MNGKRIKRVIVIAVAALLCCVAVLAGSTKLICGGPVADYSSQVELAEDEFVYQSFAYHKEGIAPVYIQDVQILYENQPVEEDYYIFWCKRQNGNLGAEMLTLNEFQEKYGENLVSPQNVKWLKDDDFDVTVLTQNIERTENYEVIITYKVFGIFKKTVKM